MVKGLKRAYPLDDEEAELSLGLSVGGSNSWKGADGSAGGEVRTRDPLVARRPVVMNVLVASRSGSGRSLSHLVAAWSRALANPEPNYGCARMRRGLLGRSSPSVLVRGWSSSGSDSSNSSTPTLASERPREQEVISNPRPPTQAQHSSPPAVDRMPCVVTKGTDGRTVRGLLYRYNEGEVRIVCVCHGGCFSPAGFVKHAGGAESSNPMRQIVVVPSQAAN